MLLDDTAEVSNAPTPERYNHGHVEQAQGIVKADPGDFGIPFQVCDILQRLLDRGVISQDELLAGERFRAWFVIAGLETLRAADMGRPAIDHPSRFEYHPSYRAERARNCINDAIRWVGGGTSRAGSCLWHVIGLDESLRRWAATQREINHLNATGILVATLECLARMPWCGPWEETS